MVRALFFLLVISPFIASGQFSYSVYDSIPVQGEDRALGMAWAGGLNAAQFNVIDLNADGKEDLLIFDRMANKVLTYLNQNDQYKYAPYYEALIPGDVANYILLRDFNQDGKKDLFTSDVLGIKVYMNTTMPGENLSWQQFFFFAGPGEEKSAVLLTKGFSGLVNLQMQFDDLPSITDLDGDGDLDILNMRYAGDGAIEFHQNFSMERYGTADSLAYERISQTWGNVKECVCGVFAFNSTACPPEGGRTEHAGGKSLLALDVDGDGDHDLLISEASCSNLYLLTNEGTSTAPVFNTSSNFPAPFSLEFDIFPSAFYEDVDFDGVKDLMITPNIYSKTTFNTFLNRSNWFYKNTGTTASPSFTLISNNFLQADMIDVGDNAVPAFTDADGDGDQDMFISNHASDNFRSKIAFYENIGTITTPEFRLATDNYIGLSGFNHYNVKISFADMNGDSKSDLVFSGTNLQNGQTSLYFLANQSTGKLDVDNQLPIPILALAYTDNVCPVDVDLDGKTDLLIGKSNGAVEYRRNVGPLSYALEDATFLGLASTITRQHPVCVTGDLNSDGKSDLIIGDQSGYVQIVSDFRNVNDISGLVAQIVYNPVTETLQAHDLGGRIWPTIVNLFNTNKPAIVVGNILGGVQVLKNTDDNVLPDIADIRVSPNPARDVLTVYADRPVFMRIYSGQGHEVKSVTRINPNEIFLVDISSFAQGLYILQFSYAGAPQINYSGTPHVTAAFPALLGTPFALLSDGILNHAQRKTISFRIIKN